MEMLEIADGPSHIEARGMILSGAGETPFGASYNIRLRPDWTFEALNLRMLDGRTLRLRSDGRGAWIGNDDAPLTDLAKCVDIDLSGTPFTNTLPIRRVSHTPGEPQGFTMAFVDMDTLSVTPREQCYTQLSPTRFRYLSVQSGFIAEIEIDSDGFVVFYPGLFQRIED